MVLDLSEFLSLILSLFSIGILFIFFLFPENYIIGIIFSGYYLVLVILMVLKDCYQMGNNPTYD